MMCIGLLSGVLGGPDAYNAAAVPHSLLYWLQVPDQV